MNLISSEGAVKAAFSCKTNDLTSVLKFLKATMKKTWLEERPYCEITIKTNEVEFATIGARKSLFCDATGPARFSISFAYFLHLVKDRPKVKTNLSVGEGFMTINEVTVVVETWFFQDDSILRSIDLPINYGMVNLLRLSLKYTEREIEFNKLSVDYHAAFKTLANETKLISAKLKKFGIEKSDVEKFIHDKIFITQKTMEL